MLLDLDSLDAFDHEALREVLGHTSAPHGYDWPRDASPLERLVAWAHWGISTQREAELDLDHDGWGPGLRFDVDSLHHGEWALIDLLDAEARGPDGEPWPPDCSTLGRLVAWAQFGRRLDAL